MADNKHNSDSQQSDVERLNETLTATGAKIAENKKSFLWIIGGIIAAGILVAAYFYFFHTPGVEKAFNEYGKVEIAPNSNDTTLAEGYKKVADKYSGSDAGRLAALEAAQHYYEIGKYQEAITYIDKFKTSDEVLDANVMILKGDCYVNMKKYNEAISSFQAAATKAKGNSEIEPRALFKIATVYEMGQQKYAQAIEIYQQIEKEYPEFNINGMPMQAFIERDQARLGR